MSEVEGSDIDSIGTGPPKLVECLIDRDQTDLPCEYLPNSPGVLIAGDIMLSASGYRQTDRNLRTPGWYKFSLGVFRRDTLGDLVHQVRRCGGFWVVECFVKDDFLAIGRNIHVLVCPFSGRPICTRNYSAAMRLADYCAPIPQPPIAAYWKPILETGLPLDAALAARRRWNGKDGYVSDVMLPDVCAP